MDLRSTVNEEKASFLHTPKDNEMVNNNEKTKYGWRNFRPQFLQHLNKPWFYLICLSSISFGQGLVCTGIANAVATTVEKRHGFKSTHLGLFKTCFFISSGLFCALVCYFGHKHRPFTIAVGCMFISFGSFIISISHFINSNYIAGVSMVTDTCHRDINLNVTSNLCSSQQWDNQGLHIFIFIFGNILMGLGVTPLYSLGFAHIDDITPRGKSNLYQGIMGAVSALGPAVGFLITNPILNIYVDIQQPPNSILTQKNRNWVGAWWIGYLVGAAILLLPILPMLGIPKLFPDTEELKAEKLKQQDSVAADKTLNNDVKSLWPSTKALFKNLPFLFICLGSASEGLSFGGFSTFIPKFIETQFHISAGRAAMLTGVIVVPGAAGGIFMGGVISRRFNWNCKQALRGASMMSFVASICILSVLIGCESRKVVGGSIGYYNSSTVNLEDTCNKGCQCSTRYYKPVCSSDDQRTYYSPCHAGCSKENAVDGKYFNCSCLSTGLSHVTLGSCIPECNLFPVFGVILLAMMFFTLMNNVPLLYAIFRSDLHDRYNPLRPSSDASILLLYKILLSSCFKWLLNFIPVNTLQFTTSASHFFVFGRKLTAPEVRIVPEGQGSFAMGFQQMFIRILGFIPAPTMFGLLIDESCKLWHKDECTGETKSCLEYDNQKFRYYMFFLGFITKFLSFLFIFIAYKLYKLPPSKITDPIEDTECYKLENRNKGVIEQKDVAKIIENNEKIGSQELYKREISEENKIEEIQNSTI